MTPEAIEALVQGRCGDPFALLGRHGEELRSFQPGANSVQVLARESGAVLASLPRIHSAGFFAGPTPPGLYRLRVDWPDLPQDIDDPYSFGPLLGALDLHLFAEGRHFELARVFGAQAMQVDGIVGVRFAVWAPNARRVSVVGGFNGWDGRRHPMRLRVEAGVWELFIPGLPPGTLYKYEILDRDGQVLPLKADPLALATEAPPETASRVADPRGHRWADQGWMRDRARRHAPDAPISIYEVHAASWWRDPAGASPSWEGLADRLIPYAQGMGFTHLELLPIMEHPFGGSWGYQPLSMFAPSARFGAPEGFSAFVDRCHAAGLGVILDWVPAHFPTDAHGLYRFDGTALYEHADPREGFHRDWDTAIYNFGREEVRGFLLASALHWLEHHHVDGLRVDAVASMLYRDYSRPAGEWVPNRHGGRENEEAVRFVQELNAVVAQRCPGTMVIAEESTAWPGVTNPTDQGGLGFSYKWNMGWMHDTLHFMQQDPVNRRWHHDSLTFGLVYAWTERFVLPLSHDEVVYGKGSLINKMPGDDWQRFANLRAYLGFMWTMPGRKLIFMGGEFAQPSEWNHDTQLSWPLLDDPRHRGMQRLVHDLNAAYRTHPALHRQDSSAAGFRWVVADDRANSVFAWLRLGNAGDPPALVVSNFTPVPRQGYRVGVPQGGQWREVLNTDGAGYGGSNSGNGGVVEAQPGASQGFAHALDLFLPPLATIILLAEAGA